MIVSINQDSHVSEFENILSASVAELEKEALRNSSYFLSRTGGKLEKDVFEIVCSKAKNTSFEGQVNLISGQKFPDIVAYVNAQKGFGVEVKSSKNKNNWRTVGSSVMEGTRIDHVTRIYLLFGRLVDPIKFKCRKYEECLYDVAITHSPRYLVDMETSVKATIFDKVGIPYDALRQSVKPFDPIKKYLRQNLRGENEDVWWVDETGEGISNIAELIDEVLN